MAQSLVARQHAARGGGPTIPDHPMARAETLGVAVHGWVRPMVGVRVLEGVEAYGSTEGLV